MFTQATFIYTRSNGINAVITDGTVHVMRDGKAKYTARKWSRLIAKSGKFERTTRNNQVTWPRKEAYQVCALCRKPLHLCRQGACPWGEPDDPTPHFEMERAYDQAKLRPFTSREADEAAGQGTAYPTLAELEELPISLATLDQYPDLSNMTGSGYFPAYV